MYDLVIRDGTVIDGSGAPGIRADLAIKNGKIAQISRQISESAQQAIDAGGRYVTPGFIDIHRHADINLFLPSFGEAELRQGLTTIVNGNCGLSVVPCPPAHRAEIFRFLQPVIGEAALPADFSTMGEYLSLAEQMPLPLNVGMDIGNGTVRAAVKGYQTGRLTREELAAARRFLHDSLEAGALGVSLGIVYAPENCYDADGFVEVLRPMKEFGVPLVTHIRGEGDLFHQSLYEVIDIARRLEVPLHVSHLKCIGKRNWGHGVKKALEILAKARASGMDVSYDVYPYTAGSTQLIQILPPDYLEGGVEEMVRRLKDPAKRRELAEILRQPQDYFENLVSSIGWGNIRMSTLTLPENQKYVGKSVSEIAATQGKDPCECVCDMLADEQCKISMVDFITSEDDICTILRDPYSSVISDSVYPTGGVPHPRLYDTFPRILQTYVRERGVLTLEQAIHKMTALPACVYHLKKGLLQEGADADVNVFALENIQTDATYEDPKRFATGFDYVLVNGEIAVNHDRMTHKPAGKVLRR
ncbi:N-acyl-D-amino-acid deacylase family protein [Marasmitruncus massiliensis]|uniref:N-acyl-D-amino-acid deacylase family protein n=1 Tax=Marasmitruncus massiliensis TaxID=1944642 RepID=UPI000C7CFD94|nr:D-aminoacylase [Marasmitruncus massiliensis]